MANTLTFKPIRELAGLIASKSVSPTELTQSFLERLEKFGPHYNSLVTLTADRALATLPRQAEAEDTGGGAQLESASGHTLGGQGPAGHRRRHPHDLGRGSFQGPAV